MRLLDTKPFPGMPYNAIYYVEEDPGFRFTYMKGVPVYLPMPRVVHEIVGPSDKARKEKRSQRSYASKGVFAIDRPYESGDPLYFMPLPNTVGPRLESYVYFRWYICSGNFDADFTLSIEDQLTQLIEWTWESSFNYYRYQDFLKTEYLAAYEWLTNSDLSDPRIQQEQYMVSPTQFKKWEKLSLKKAQELPWGKFALKQGKVTLDLDSLYDMYNQQLSSR